MTRKLEELFNLDDVEEENQLSVTDVSKETLKTVDESINKIDQALPSVRGLDASDSEMDELASKASETFDSLMALGFNVEPRHSARLFEVASSMLGHAITAKTAKMDKKLKMIKLQLDKARLDQNSGNDDSTPGEGQVLDRNELLQEILRQSKEDNQSDSDS